MELAGAALPSAAPVGARGSGSGRRRRAPGRVACVGGGGFAEEGHRRYYEAPTAPRRKAVEADLARIRATGLVAGNAAKEEVLSQATDLLLQELNQMKDEECKTKEEARKEEKAAMKALKKQQQEAAKKAATAMSCEEEGYSSESSESDCEEEPAMRAGQGMAVPAAVPEVVAPSVPTVSGPECEKAAMKATKKMEKERMKALKKTEKERKAAAKRAVKMEKEARKMAVAAAPNGCRDGEDGSSCSSESSDSECEGQVVRVSRCATIAAPGAAPAPPTAALPVIVPQIPAPLAPEPPQAPAAAVQAEAVGARSLAVAETPSTADRIEVCMGGKCKKAGALALLQELEKAVGTGGAVAGCKCLGKCGLGPNVRLRSGLAAEGSASAKGNPLCIGVGLEDVGTIVAGLFGDGDLGMTLN